MDKCKENELSIRYKFNVLRLCLFAVDVDGDDDNDDVVFSILYFCCKSIQGNM